MQPTCSMWLAVIGLLFSLPVEGIAEPVAYNFTAIANDIRQPGFASTIYPPALNNVGTVAFTIAVDNPGISGIFSGNGGPLTTIATSNSSVFPVFFPKSRPSINDASTVAFRADLGTTPGMLTGSGMFAGSGGALSPIVVTRFVGIYTSLNDAGTGAFFVIQGTGSIGIFTATNRSTDTIADTSGIFSDFPDADPQINNSGTVAFAATLDTGSFGIFSSNGGQPTTIADTTGPFSNFLTHSSINDAGMVAFEAALRIGGSGIFTGRGGPVTTIADTNGPFRSFSFSSINKQGAVAFMGFLDAGGEGIFTGPDRSADQVINTGNPLFGSTVTTLLFGPEGLNDVGQVAFLATLADGRIVIARADPFPIPEPATWLLLATGCAGLLGYGWRRRLRAS